MKISSSWCSDEDMPLGEAKAMGGTDLMVRQQQIPCGDDNKKERQKARTRGSGTGGEDGSAALA
jgi:hypothetical protein